MAHTHGIFVTTSIFSAEAIESARKRNNTVQLIDDEFFTQTQHAKHHT
ncbi:restriction endonuclease [Leuconostoc gelidum subsp. gasicomitatum]|nr:restriction endonuclease [Leuconostoc gasicomitatum]